MGSEPGKLDAVDARKIARGLAMSLAAAAAVYATNFVIPQLQQSGSAVNLLLAAVLTAGIDAVRRWLADNR